MFSTTRTISNGYLIASRRFDGPAGKKQDSWEEKHYRHLTEIGQLRRPALKATSQKLDSWEGGKRQLKGSHQRVTERAPAGSVQASYIYSKLEQLLGSLVALTCLMWISGGARSATFWRDPFDCRLPLPNCPILVRYLKLLIAPSQLSNFCEVL